MHIKKTRAYIRTRLDTVCPCGFVEPNDLEMTEFYEESLYELFEYVAAFTHDLCSLFLCENSRHVLFRGFKVSK